MKVTVTGMSITPAEFQIGLRIEYSTDGPVRFARCIVGAEALDWKSLAALAAFQDRATRLHMERERELDDELPLELVHHDLDG